MSFDFGENIEGISTQPTVIQRSQLAYPLDQQSIGIIQDVLKKNIPTLNRVQAITLVSGTTRFEVRNTDVMDVSASAAVSIDTITNGYNGQILTLIFNDANVTLVHSASGNTGTLNLGGSNLTSSANATVQLIHDGTSWFINTVLNLSAISGTIGGFTIGATTISATNLTLTSGAANTANITVGTGATAAGLNSANAAGDISIWAGSTFANRATAPFRVEADGDVIATSVVLSTSVAISGIANNTSTDISLLGLTHDIVFSVTDADTIAWAAGTINLSNGRTFSIVAGNTGNMLALTYIYLDTTASSTVLQTTTTYSTAIGANKVLLGTAQNQTVTASFIPFGGGGGGQPLIDGAQIGALSIVAGNIAASTITAGKMSVTQLSAIAADLGTITAGTITGATIRTAASGARFNMNTTDLQGIDDASNIVFQVIVSGANVGDVMMGRYSSNEEGILWDKSAGRLKIRQREIKFFIRSEDMTNTNSAINTQDDFEFSLNLNGVGTEGAALITDTAKADSTKDFTFEADIKESSVGIIGATESAFWGIKGSTSVLTQGANYPTPANGNMTEDHAGFIFYEDPAVPNATLLIASVADGTTQTKSSSISVTTTNFNRYRIERVGTSIYFFVNNVLQATLTTNLPDDTTCALGFLGQAGGGVSHIVGRQGWSYIEEI